MDKLRQKWLFLITPLFQTFGEGILTTNGHEETRIGKKRRMNIEHPTLKR